MAILKAELTNLKILWNLLVGLFPIGQIVTLLTISFLLWLAIKWTSFDSESVRILSILIITTCHDGYKSLKLSRTGSNLLHGKHQGVLKTKTTSSDWLIIFFNEFSE